LRFFQQPGRRRAFFVAVGAPERLEFDKLLGYSYPVAMKKSAPKATTPFRLVDCGAWVSEIRTRIPFRYGSACLTASPSLLVQVTIETAAGKQAVGLAGDCLPPAWFDKNPKKTYKQQVDDQIGAFRKAREIYLLLGDSFRSTFELWEEVYPRVLEEGLASGWNALTAAFGSSFFERATIDAVCRAGNATFHEGLKSGLLGIDGSQHLPPRPLRSVACRHTVGLGDPLTIGEIPQGERLNDALPQALEEDIEFYGLRCFKVKVQGNNDHDVQRLSRLAALFSQRCRNGYMVSLDGNEQYESLDGLHALVEALRERPYGQEFVDSIAFIEQPLHRDLALDRMAAAGITELGQLKPVIIDESDDQLDSFTRAVDLGYRGTSHKNCKGIFRSLHNNAKVHRLNKERGEQFYFQTAEDLVNLPVLPLHQDLASICALGIEHAERNGHHFFRGLDHLPREEAEATLRAHPDLYEEREDSVFLRVVDGTILCDSIVDAHGYGYASEISRTARTPLDDWSFDSLGL
jgi:hypothetical protein